MFFRMLKLPYGTLHLGNLNRPLETAESVSTGSKWDALCSSTLNETLTANDRSPRSPVVHLLSDPHEISLLDIVIAANNARVFSSEFCLLSNGSVIIRIFFVPTASRSTLPTTSFSKLSDKLGYLLNHVSTASSHWSGCPADKISCGNFHSRLNPVVCIPFAHASVHPHPHASP